MPRLELAARLKAAGLQATSAYATLRDNTARELKGRPDGVGLVTVEERNDAEDAIVRQIGILQGAAPPPRTLGEIAKLAASWPRRRAGSATCRAVRTTRADRV